ncbi:hypothetical protein DYB35_009717 [Aphanomyces astaci]|nr:hypothetical protein DYB35_009717 [Aphanomyces astaci]
MWRQGDSLKAISARVPDAFNRASWKSQRTSHRIPVHDERHARHDRQPAAVHVFEQRGGRRRQLFAISREAGVVWVGGLQSFLRSVVAVALLLPATLKRGLLGAFTTLKTP